MSRLLFISFFRQLGDTVICSSLLRHFVQKSPHVRVTLAVGSHLASLFQGLDQLETIVPFDWQPYGAHRWKLWAKTVATPWDAVVDCKNSKLSYFLWARKRYVWNSDAMPQGKTRLAQMSQWIGEELDLPCVWLSTSTQDNARAIFQSLVADQCPLISLGLFAREAQREWPLAYFNALMDLLKTVFPASAKFILWASPTERHRLGLLQLREDVIVLPMMAMGELAWILQKTSLFIGNDSGLAHLAAALNVPTVAMFGVGCEKTFCPQGAYVACVRTPESREELRLISQSESAMRNLLPETVFQVAQELLKRHSDAVS